MSSTRKILPLGLCLFLVVVTFIITWEGKEFLDETYMLEGRFMIVNASASEHRIGVTFPSGKQFEATIRGGGSHTVEIDDTGEGGLQVTVDGTPRTKKNGVGYVTGINPMMVVVVGDDHLSAHQVIPGIALEAP
jgi:hypothetical protein